MTSSEPLLISILEQISAATVSNGNKLNQIIELLGKIEAHGQQIASATKCLDEIYAIGGLTGHFDEDGNYHHLADPIHAIQVKIVDF